MTGSMAQTLGKTKKKIAGISRQRSSLDAEHQWRYYAKTDVSNETSTVVRWRDLHLCSFCEKLFTRSRKGKPLGVAAEHPTNQTLLEMELSAQNGCHFCFMRMEQLSIRERAELHGWVQIQFGFWTDRRSLGVAFEYFYPVQLARKEKPCLSKGYSLVDGGTRVSTITPSSI
jgi:hypothetical protein